MLKKSHNIHLRGGEILLRIFFSYTKQHKYLQKILYKQITQYCFYHLFSTQIFPMYTLLLLTAIQKPFKKKLNSESKKISYLL